jgi:hypothetical protein
MVYRMALLLSLMRQVWAASGIVRLSELMLANLFRFFMNAFGVLERSLSRAHPEPRGC